MQTLQEKARLSAEPCTVTQRAHPGLRDHGAGGMRGRRSDLRLALADDDRKPQSSVPNYPSGQKNNFFFKVIWENQNKRKISNLNNNKERTFPNSRGRSYPPKGFKIFCSCVELKQLFLSETQGRANTPDPA